MNDRDETAEHINDQVKRVAEALPFPVQLDADMGGTFVLQIDLGNRGGEDHPHDTAGIDPDDEAGPRWWVDIEGGEKTFISDYGLRTDPTTVAAWIATTARAENSPAAAAETTTDRTRSIVSASFPSSPDQAVTAGTPAATAAHETPRRAPGHER